MVRSKKSLLTERDIQQNQTEEGAPICCAWLGFKGKEMRGEKAEHRETGTKCTLREIVHERKSHVMSG